MTHGLHHLLKRQRLGVARAFDSLMLVVSLCAPLTLLPQILQAFESKNVAGLSLGTWGLLCLINLMWSLYGRLHRERLIFLANFLMALLDLVIVIEILLYR